MAWEHWNYQETLKRIRKLSDKQVKEIREQKAKGISMAKIAKDMSIPYGTVVDCAKYKSYKHLP